MNLNEKKIKIGIALRGLTKGGVTRFIFGLLKGFEKYADKFDFCVFYNDKDLEGGFSYAKKIYIKGKNRLIWDYFRLPAEVRKYDPDYVIFPKNIIPLSFIFSSAKKFNIIHDLAYFDKKLNAYSFWDTLYMKTFMGLSCKIAHKVLAVSENTKKDIEKILKIPSEKIEVIYEGVEDSFKKRADVMLLKRLNIKTPYIFYCGEMTPRKNLLRALQAFYSIKNEIPHNFYITGGSGWKEKEVLKYISENLPDRACRIGHVEEDELIALYSSADLFVYPSIYEGFGLPILEAQACGCPVLTSDKTSCPEVAGEGAIIVDPNSVKGIADGILKVLNNRSFADDLIQKGHDNLKRFSWDKTAEKILES